MEAVLSQGVDIEIIVMQGINTEVSISQCEDIELVVSQGLNTEAGHRYQGCG